MLNPINILFNMFLTVRYGGKSVWMSELWGLLNFVVFFDGRARVRLRAYALSTVRNDGREAKAPDLWTEQLRAGRGARWSWEVDCGQKK
jgi:hypothetical protein